MQLDEPGYAGFTELFGIKIFTAIFLHQNGDCSSHYRGVILLFFFFKTCWRWSLPLPHHLFNNMHGLINDDPFQDIPCQ